jgi:hypothetical protein
MRGLGTAKTPRTPSLKGLFEEEVNAGSNGPNETETPKRGTKEHVERKETLEGQHGEQ